MSKGTSAEHTGEVVGKQIESRRCHRATVAFQVDCNLPVTTLGGLEREEQ